MTGSFLILVASGPHIVLFCFFVFIISLGYGEGMSSDWLREYQGVPKPY